RLEPNAADGGEIVAFGCLWPCDDPPALVARATFDGGGRRTAIEVAGTGLQVTLAPRPPFELKPGLKLHPPPGRTALAAVAKSDTGLSLEVAGDGGAPVAATPQFEQGLYATFVLAIDETTKLGTAVLALWPERAFDDPRLGAILVRETVTSSRAATV